MIDQGTQKMVFCLGWPLYVHIQLIQAQQALSNNNFESRIDCHGSAYDINKANPRDLIAVTGLVILLKLDSNCRFFSPRDLYIWLMTSKNKRAPLLYCIKLCAPFQIHWWIHTGVSVRKLSIQVKICDFFSCVTLQFDGWPWKSTGHLLYTALSVVHHFKAIGKFNFTLKSRKPPFGSKSAIFLFGVTLKFDGWPWKSIGHPYYVASSFVHHFIDISKF